MGFNSAFKGLKLLKKTGKGCLNNLNDPVLNVLIESKSSLQSSQKSAAGSHLKPQEQRPRKHSYVSFSSLTLNAKSFITKNLRSFASFRRTKHLLASYITTSITVFGKIAMMFLTHQINGKKKINNNIRLSAHITREF